MQENGVGDIHTDTMYSGFTNYSFLSFPGSLEYAFSHLPVVCTLIGDRVLKHKGLKTWRDGSL